MKNNFLIQYIWIIVIAVALLCGGLMLQSCTFTYDEDKAFQKEWEKLDKQLEKEKNDNN